MVRRLIFAGEVGAKFIPVASCAEQRVGVQRDEQEMVHVDRKVAPSELLPHSQHISLAVCDLGVGDAENPGVVGVAGQDAEDHEQENPGL